MRIAAILDLEVKLASNLKNKHSILFVVLMMIEKNTSLEFIAHPMLELCGVVFFKMANGGHFEFCGFSIFSYRF